MKKIMMLFALCIGLTATAQVNYPYKRPQLLLGKEVTIKPISEHMRRYEPGYKGFYADSKMFTVYKKINALETDPDAFGDRKFKVIAIDSTKNSYAGIYGQPEYDKKITLEDTAGEKVYYQYERRSYSLVVVGGLDLPADFYCDFIKKDQDGNFTTNEDIPHINVVKTKKGGVTKYSLSYDLPQSGAEPGLGMTFLLENGKKIDRPKAFVKIHGRTATPRLNGSIELTAAEIALLKESNVASVTLNKYTDKLYGDMAENFRNAFICLLTK